MIGTGKYSFLSGENFLRAGTSGLEAFPGAACAVKMEEGLPVLAGNTAFFDLCALPAGDGVCLLDWTCGGAEDWNRVQAALTSKEPGCILERQILRDEQERWVRIEGRFLPDGQDGTPSLLFCQVRDVTEEKALRVRLELGKKRMEALLEQTGDFVFDYDIDRKIVTLPEEQSGIFTGRWRLKYFFLEEIFRRFAHPATVAELTRIHDAAASGEKQVSCEVLLQIPPEDEFRWYRISLTVLEGKRQAVGVAEDIMQRRQAEWAFAREEQYRNAILSSMAAYCEVNLTAGWIERASGLWGQRFGFDQEVSYQQILEKNLASFVWPGDREMCARVMSRENLLAAHKRGEKKVGCEYRRSGTEGETLWMQLTVHLLEMPLTGEVKALMYLRDIDQRKRRELLLEDQASRDSLTGLYNKGAAELLIREALQERRGMHHAFLILDMDHFKEVNDTFGHLYGDLVLKKVGKVLRERFRSDDICGRLGGDEFFVFMKHIPSASLAERKAEELCCAVRDILGMQAGLSCSVGVACCPEDGVTYAELYQSADRALYAAKYGGRNRYALFCDLARENAGGSVPVTEIDGTNGTLAPRQMQGMAGEEKFATMVQLLDELEEIVYVSDPDTYEIYYANRPLYAELGCTLEECVGKKCYEVIQGRSEPCPYCSRDNLDFRRYYVWEHRNEQTGNLFHIRDKWILWNGKKARLEIASVQRAEKAEN